MKLQHVTIIFAIIFLPIILITSFYIQQQVDTLRLQESYDSKLLDATHDAMMAFELNTANEDLSAVSDSLRSIIEASNNIFLNTLATNMGVSNASKSYVQPYIPAILYTLYDGYYIYSPTNAPVVCVDKFGQTISTDSYGVSQKGLPKNGIGFYEFNQDSITYDGNTPTLATGGNTVNYNDLKINGIGEEYGQILYQNKDGTYSTVLHSSTDNTATLYKKSYILKSFVPYSATYEFDDNNVTINYTLDNFITIEGEIGGVYFTKSGYLISKNSLKDIKVDGTKLGNWYDYSEKNWDTMIDGNDNNVELTIVKEETPDTILASKDASQDVKNAIKYYIKAYMFSSWVYENLSGVTPMNIKNSNYDLIDISSDTIDKDENFGKDKATELADKLMHDFSDEEIEMNKQPIFDETEDPEDAESKFVLHKRDVVRNSITYNLALSVVTYTEMSKTVEYKLPILTQEEWDKILSNVSILSFMQGLQCGLKIYNDYAIVSSTNNEITVIPNEIYYVPEEYTLEDGTTIAVDMEKTVDNVPMAHRIDCPDLPASNNNNYFSFKSKEIKYDKLFSKEAGSVYVYDHKVYTDYNCLVNSNYMSVKDGIRGNMKILEAISEDENKLRAYRVAVAKERNNLFKSVAHKENLGYEITNLGHGGHGEKITQEGDIDVDSSLCIKKILKVQIVFDKIKNEEYGVYYDNITVSLNGDDDLAYTKQGFPINSEETILTLEFAKDFIGTTPKYDKTVNKIHIKMDHATEFEVKSVRIYYK